MLKTLPTDISSLRPVQNWPAQGAWTYADYQRLPDDGRVYEIIHGVLYMASAPSYAHQYVVNRLAHALTSFVIGQELGVVLTAPFEVHLAENVRPIQPDVLFIGHAKLPPSEAAYFEGVPDMVVEVISPSSRRYDSSVKLDVYEQAGVREYWLVDPLGRLVTVYHLPPSGREYVLAGEFTAQDTLISPLLEGFQLPLNMIFPL